MPKESKASKTTQNAERNIESVFDDVALVDPKGDAIAALKAKGARVTDPVVLQLLAEGK